MMPIVKPALYNGVSIYKSSVELDLVPVHRPKIKMTVTDASLCSTHDPGYCFDVTDITFH